MRVYGDKGWAIVRVILASGQKRKATLLEEAACSLTKDRLARATREDGGPVGVGHVSVSDLDETWDVLVRDCCLMHISRSPSYTVHHAAEAMRNKRRWVEYVSGVRWPNPLPDDPLALKSDMRLKDAFRNVRREFAGLPPDPRKHRPFLCHQ